MNNLKRFKKNLKGSKGLTLIEIVITFFIISLILMSATRAFYQFYRANIRTNQMSIKMALATERLEEWKSIKGENFLPGVSFPLYTPNINTSTGVISFSVRTVTIPAVTELDIDCTNNSTVTQNTGYACTLTSGAFGNPGFGSSSTCWYEPSTRTVANENTPGSIRFTLDCPAGVTSILELTMIDYETASRTQRVLVNGITKASYIASDLVPPSGELCSIPLSASDTSSGHITVEIEQTGVVNNASVTVINNFTATSGWTLSAGTGTIVNTPTTPTPYSEESTKKSYRINSATSTTTISLSRTINTSVNQAGDYIRLWVHVDTSDKMWFTTPSGNSDTATGPITNWQQLTKIMSASDDGANIPISIKYIQNTSSHAATVYVNELTTEAASTATNPNAVLSRITLKSLEGFTDPDSTAGSPVTTASHPGYIITSSLDPTNTSAGQAIGWTVSVSVSKVNDKYGPAVISNTINR